MWCSPLKKWRQAAQLTYYFFLNGRWPQLLMMYRLSVVASCHHNDVKKFRNQLRLKITSGKNFWHRLVKIKTLFGRMLKSSIAVLTFWLLDSYQLICQVLLFIDLMLKFFIHKKEPHMVQTKLNKMAHLHHIKLGHGKNSPLHYCKNAWQNIIIPMLFEDFFKE